MSPTLHLHVEVVGREPGPDVPTFVLLHGFGGSLFSWRTWVPELSRRGHVVLVDLKGFGKADRPEDDAYGPEDQAALVSEMIYERGLEHVTLVGHSLGGGVALITAITIRQREPGRIERLVVVAGAAYRQRLPPFTVAARWPGLSGAVVRVLTTRRIVRWVLRSIVYDRSTVTPEQVGGYSDPIDSPNARRALWRAARSIVPPELENWCARYPELDVPALLLWGDHDRVIPLWVGQRLQADLPRGHLHVLEACGHLPAEECPQRSVRVLLDFLDHTDVTEPRCPPSR